MDHPAATIVERPKELTVLSQRKKTDREHYMPQLVQLDTSNHHILAKTKLEDPDRYRHFLRNWRTGDRALVFTGADLSELARYRNAELRETRLSVIEDLLPVRSDIPSEMPEAEDGGVAPRTLLEREVFAALVRKGMLRLGGDGAEQKTRAWSSVIPWTFATPEQLLLLHLLNSPALQAMYDIEHHAFQLSAEAERRAPGTAYPATRVRDLPNVPFDSSAVEKMIAEFERECASAGARADTPAILDQSEVAAISDRLMGAMRSFIERMGEVGNQQALAETLSVAETTVAPNRIPKMPVDSLVTRFVFEEQVRIFMKEVARNSDSDEVGAVLDAVKLEDCPGCWLQDAVHEQLRLGTVAPAASDKRDLQRVGFLPYVDVLFTDIRIAEFTRQALRRADRPASLATVGRVAAVAKSLDSIEQALETG